MAISEFTISGVLGVTSAAAVTPRRPAAPVGLGFTFTFRLYMALALGSHHLSKLETKKETLRESSEVN